MNILFFGNVPFNPSYGGIERVTDSLTKEFLKLGHNVFYVVMTTGRKITECKFPAKINVLPSNSFETTDKDIEFYHQFLIDNKIDVIINQFGEINNAKISLNTPKNISVKKINVIHSTPIIKLTCFRSSLRFDTFGLAIENIIKILNYPIYRLLHKNRYVKYYNYVFDNSDRVCLLSSTFYKGLSTVHKGDIEKIVYIPNMNSCEFKEVDFTTKKKQILFVGRLTYNEKRVDRLIKSWNCLYDTNPEWELIIVGDGADRQRLTNYVRKHKIERVRFEGYQQDPTKYFIDASIICLTSSFEGFPMILGEGMVHGCVPVSFDSFESIYDIIDNQKNGVIVPKFDTRKYAKELSRLMNDDELRVKMGLAAQEKAKSFSKENVVKQWTNLFDEITK